MTNSLDLNIIQPSNSRSERRDAAENREQILCTASQLFAEKGVLNVNMAEIAKAAGVGKGTLYRRFSNKGELCLSLLDEKLRAFQNEMLELLSKLTRDGSSPLAQLSTFLSKSVHFIVDNIELMVEIDAVTVSGLVQDINTPHFWFDVTIRRLLEQALAASEIRPDLDIPYTASALLAPLDARILRSHLDMKGYSVERICEGLGGMVRGLAMGDR